jgi:dTDP-4-dehydrorhamnose reductase
MLAEGSAVGILRLAKIVSPGMPLLRQWQAALAAGQSIRPFHDMVMAPTPAGVAAAAIAALLADRATGIWQLTGSQDVSYAEIGGHIAQQIGADPALVQPIAAASAGMPEGSTPRHTTLDSGALQRLFAIAAPEPWPTIEAVLATP